MKYCLFDGGDVVGPFTAKQLLLRPGFGAHSLVCPEEYSDEEAYWKEAHFYEEFGFPAQATPRPQAEEPAPVVPTEQFLKAMDTVMTELSSFQVGEKDLSLHQTDKVAKPAADQAGKEAVAPAASKRAALSADENSAKSTQENASHKTPRPVQPQVKEPAPAADAEKEIAQDKNTAPSISGKPSRPAANAKDEEQKISSILLQASEEMKRRRVGREAVSKAEEQLKKSAASEQGHLSAEQGKEAPAQPASSAGGAAQEMHIETQTVSHASPIEEYFNTIKSGDLGNILGIPDPKENSDMNLVRALESQFEKTDPALVHPIEDDPFDEFTPKAQTAEIAGPAAADTTDQADKKTEENLRRSLPDLKAAQSLPLAGQGFVEEAAQEEEDTVPPPVQEMLVPEQEDDPNDKTVKTILEGKLKVDTFRQEIPEPIKEVPPQQKAPSHASAAEMQEEPRVIKQRPVGKMKFVFLGLGVMVLLLGAYLNWTQSEAPAVSQETAEEQESPTAADVPDVPDSLPDAREAIHALPQRPAAPVQDPLELAKEIVQNYPLDNGRGTVEEYLNRLYSKQLKEGYAAVWSAEPLHRNSYVVKYRLAKTRKEPIVYIFQADTAKKKLTGALNNITLDLVGKIK